MMMMMLMIDDCTCVCACMMHHNICSGADGRGFLTPLGAHPLRTPAPLHIMRLRLNAWNESAFGHLNVHQNCCCKEKRTPCQALCEWSHGFNTTREAAACACMLVNLPGHQCVT